MAQRKTRKPKKSETLEVRLDHETKKAFIETCRENGATASDVVRSAIDRYLARNRRPTPETNDGVSAMIVPFVKKRKRVLAGGVGAVTLAAMVAMPSAAGPDLKAAFGRLDKNGDGRLTMEEFMGPEAGDSDQVERRIEKIIEDNGESAARDGREPGELVIVAETFAVLLPPEDGDADGQWGVEMQASRSIKGGDRGLTEDVMDPRLEEFAGMDTNGDGDVSLSEFQARMRALFTRGFELLDENGDGALTKAEFAVSADGQALLRRSPTGIDQDGDPGPVETLSDVQVEAGFAAMDKNGDAGLSLEEYLSAI